MPSDFGDRRTPKAQNVALGGGSNPAPPPPQSENLPCPRCDSSNTKFCYYNNYNFSQPRHFCKSCRRYWTQGGTLRNVPVGGGTRKNSKRCRTASFSSSPSAPSSTVTQEAIPGNAVSENVNVHENVFASSIGGGSFTSLLSSQGQGFLALSGYGYGLEEMGFGLGKGVWPYPELPNVGDCDYGRSGGDGEGVSGGAAVMSSGGCNTWQMSSGLEAGMVEGDCFTWPELAISTPGNGLK